MKILITASSAEPASQIVKALRKRESREHTLRCLGPSHMNGADESVVGNMNDPAVISDAVVGIDAIVHCSPELHPREAAIGTSIVDAAQSERVRRFVFLSTIHPQVDDLVNHRAKLAVEAHLINSRLEWCVLRPQHYMQSVDVRRAVTDGRLNMPYPLTTVRDHVDLQDLAEVAALVATEDGHAYATYDLSASELLSVSEICELISRLSGRSVGAVATEPKKYIEELGAERREGMSDYEVDALHRLFGYHSRHRLAGNANVLKWLLRRPPGTFEAFVRRELSEARGTI